MILERRSVNLVAAALDVHVDRGAAHQTKLGVVTAGHGLHRIDRFESRDISRGKLIEVVGCGSSIDSGIVDLLRSTVDVNRQRCGRVGTPNRASAAYVEPRQQAKARLKIPANGSRKVLQ